MLNMTPNSVTQAPQQPGAGQPAAAAAPASTPVATTLEQRWANYFASPSVRAAALQFAVSAIQPIPQGQTVGGHIGLAVGDAAQAAGRSAAFQNKVATDQAEISQGQQSVDIAREGNEISREELGVRKEDLKTRREQAAASAAYTAGQDKIKNALDARRVAAYETMAKNAGGTSADKTLLKERLDLISSIAQDRALFEDDFDPLAYFDEQAAKLTGSATPVAEGGTGVTPTAPKAGEVVEEGGKKYKFLGGNAADPNAWEEVK